MDYNINVNDEVVGSVDVLEFQQNRISREIINTNNNLY